jgi:hypothetical protein
MATTLTHKRSSTAGSIPTTTDLAFGEIAINSNDGHIFIKKDEGSSEEVITFRPSSMAYEDSVYLDTATGDGSTTAYTLPRSPKDDQYVFVTINGVQQQTASYSISNDELTFSSAPANGDDIEFRVLETISADVSLRDKQKYFFSIGTTTGSITGTDDNGLTLTYDPGKVDVFQNGVKLIENSDYTASTGTSISFATSLEDGDIIEVDSWASAAILDADAIKPASQTFSTTTADQTLDVFNSITYRTAKYIVSVSSGSDYHATEILLMHNGTSVFMTEYATIYTTSSLASFDADINNGLVRLLCTPTNSNTTVKLQRISVTV